jgi:tetratricopeptide (TPR) repeat protein
MISPLAAQDSRQSQIDAGWKAFNANETKIALGIFQQALDQSNRLRVKDFTTAKSHIGIGDCYRQLGDNKAAEPAFRAALEICESSSGRDSNDAAYCVNRVALAVESQGRYDEAEPLYRRALQIRETNLTATDANVLQSVDNLGTLLLRQARYQDAEPLIRHALRIREETKGKDHLDTACSLSSLAGLLQSQGKYAVAEPLYRRALQIYEAKLGSDHPATGGSCRATALCLAVLDQTEEADRLFARGCRIANQQPRSGDKDRASELSEKARRLFQEEQFQQSEAMALRSVAAYRQLVGPYHHEYTQHILIT